MRLALISEHASPLAPLGSVDAGGQNVYVREVAGHLAAAGHQVDVFTRRDAAQLPETVEVAQGFRVVHVPAGPPEWIPKEDLLPLVPEMSEWIARWMSAHDYDLIHANFFMSGLVARDLRARLGIPYVVTFHALGAVRRLHLGNADRFVADRVALEQAVMDDAATVVAECPQDVADLIRWYDIPRGRIATVPCGVDTRVFRPVGRDLARLRRRWSPEEWIILHVGRMVPRKGVDTVIEALAQVVERGVETARLVVAGGCSPDPDADPYIAKLRKLARRLGVGERVRFLGSVSHQSLPHLYGASDVFVTTPWYEPFGITPLEAMACGLPVVGSNVGGIKFSVRDGETGYLVPPRTPSAVADRLIELHALPGLAASLAENARRRTEDLFTWSAVTESLASVYTGVLDGGIAVSDAGAPHLVQAIDELTDVLGRVRSLEAPVTRAARMIADALRAGGRVLVAGNGGSAAEAQHFAAELVGRFVASERRALDVVSLTADTAVLTAWANDVGYADVFARQVEGLGRAGDVLVGLSTSGQSENLIRAFDTAQRRGMRTVGILGNDGGSLAALSHAAVVVPSRDTQRIQEVHGLLVHVVSALVEEATLCEPLGALDVASGSQA